MALTSTPAEAAKDCRVCHRMEISGIHADLSCTDCHRSEVPCEKSAAGAAAASECTGCHADYERILGGVMATRMAEQEFAERAFGRYDPQFFSVNCQGCHLQGCQDCHGSGHKLARPDNDPCLSCHKGYFVGSDYLGLAPREDSLRYQRGPERDAERYLKMLPDVHAENGMACAECHSMASLLAGEKTAKSCRDCHTPDPQVVEHSVVRHLDRMECSACHSAWAPQEYGSFFLRLETDSPKREYFRLRPGDGPEYLRSAYLRRQDAPPLGQNAAGRVSPIRPEFIAFFSDLREGGNAENVLLAAQWKAFSPHTVRAGSVLCEGCHETPRRFVMEAPEQRIYQLQEDGLPLGSFWQRDGQQVVNGSFLEEDRVRALNRPSPEYTRKSLEKWQRLLKNVESSSGR